MASMELPSELVDRVHRRAKQTPGSSAADVIRDALDSLEREDADRIAIQAGIDDMETGRVRPFVEFDQEFRQRFAIGDDP